MISGINLYGYVRISPTAGGPPIVAHRSDLRGLPSGKQLTGLQVLYRTTGHRHGRKAIDVEAGSPADVAVLEPVAEANFPSAAKRLVDQADVDDPRLDDAPDGAGPNAWDPSLEEIASAAASVRAGWSEAEYRSRSPYLDRWRTWSPPGVLQSVARLRVRRETADDRPPAV